MDKICDINSYLRSMSATMYDKCWWIDKISPEIDTVVDFGCAQGDLALYLDRLRPDKFRYIGVDNSEEMVSLARHNHYLHFDKSDSEFCQEISDVIEKCNPSKTVLVLNSVVHEIFSYMSDSSASALLSEMFDMGFHSVAIRDMYKYDNVGRLDKNIFNIAVSRSPYAGMWNDYNACVQSTFGQAAPKMEDRIVEFLLKYRYASNWAREMREIYLWDWLPMISRQTRHYGVTFEDSFSIPYISQRVREDIGIDFAVNTHKKVLFTRKQCCHILV